MGYIKSLHRDYRWITESGNQCFWAIPEFLREEGVNEAIILSLKHPSGSSEWGEVRVIVQDSENENLLMLHRQGIKYRDPKPSRWNQGIHPNGAMYWGDDDGHHHPELGYVTETVDYDLLNFDVVATFYWERDSYEVLRKKWEDFDFDRDWKQELANEAGMLHGLSASNCALGYDLSRPYDEEEYL